MDNGNFKLVKYYQAMPLSITLGTYTSRVVHATGNRGKSATRATLIRDASRAARTHAQITPHNFTAHNDALSGPQRVLCDALREGWEPTIMILDILIE